MDDETRPTSARITTETIVERFVAALRRDGIRVDAIEAAPWITAFEQSLPRRLSASYASLVYRYRFPPFDRGGISFFGNMGDGSDWDLTVAAIIDPYLSKPALDSGLLQIGRPDTGTYDAVCLDSRGVKNRREYPLVVLDHEALLQFQRVVVMKEMDESFLSFMLRNGAAG